MEAMNKMRIICILLLLSWVNHLYGQEITPLQERNDTVYIYFNPKDTTICHIKSKRGGMLGKLIGKKDTIIIRDASKYRKHIFEKNTAFYKKGDIKFGLCGIKAGYVFREGLHKSFLIDDHTELKLDKIEKEFDFSYIHQKTKFIVELLCDKKAMVYEVESGMQVRE